jgi:hypothetical protein
VACILLIDLTIRGGDLVAHYTDLGALPLELRNSTVRFQGQLSLLDLNGSVWFASLHFGLLVAAALALLTGAWTRIATPAAWVLLASLQNRNALVNNSGDDLLRILLLIGCFLPLEAHASGDAAAGAARPAVSWSARCAFAVVKVQILAVYVSAALWKSANIEWRQGVAFYRALAAGAHIRPLGHSLANLIHGHDWVGWTVLAWEGFAAFLVLVPSRFWKIRTAAVLLFWGFHTGIAATMNVGLFSLVAMAAWSLTLPTGFWTLLGRGKPARAAGRPGPIPVPHLAILTLACGLIGLINANDVPVSPVRGRLTSWVVHGPVAYLQLQQTWRVFSTAAGVDEWWSTQNILASGEKGDPFEAIGLTGGKAHPDDNEAVFPNEHWRKFILSLGNAEYTVVMSGFCGYLCRRWNAEHSGDQALRVVNLYRWTSVLSPDGGLEEATGHLQWSQQCAEPLR